MVRKLPPASLRKIISKAFHGKKLTKKEQTRLRNAVDSKKYHL